MHFFTFNKNCSAQVSRMMDLIFQLDAGIKFALFLVD